MFTQNYDDTKNVHGVDYYLLTLDGLIMVEKDSELLGYISVDGHATETWEEIENGADPIADGWEDGATGATLTLDGWLVTE